MTPVARLVDVAAGYNGQAVVSGITFTVQPGDLLGAVGPSGSGKTTLLRLLTGRAELYGGTVELFGRPVRPGRSIRGVGYVPQLGSVQWDFPINALQVVLLGLAAGSTRSPWFSARERRRAESLLERLGLGGLGQRHISELSGGQQQRMFLARAMIAEADLILLDEPTSGVDLKTRHDILHLLGELNADGLTIMLTTHDLNWVAAHLPRVLCLNGTVLADGSPLDVFTPEVLRHTYGADVRVVRDGNLVFVTDPTHLLSTSPESLPR